MTRLTKRWVFGGVALGALLSASSVAFAAGDAGAIDARLRALEAEIAKLRKEAREAKVQAAAASNKATNVANAAHGKADPAAPPPPPPVFVSFKNGLFVETGDRAYSFKIGGRMVFDGGGTSQPLGGLSSNAGLRQGRLEVEGKAANIWFYKLQYDFAGNGSVAGNNQVLGGVRDFFFGIQHPAMALPFSSDPAYIMIGSQFEPYSIEGQSSTKFRPFIERAMSTEALFANRHVGISIGGYGDQWTGRIGLFSTSYEDAAFSPAVNAPAMVGIPKAAGWVSTGGAQYVDLAGRFTYAPIRDEHKLLHFGVSGRYHSENDATGANDDRMMMLGNRVPLESPTVLSQKLLGTPDLSCGAVAPFGSPTAVSGKCTRFMTSYAFELAGAYGPFDFQAEYFANDYSRNMGNILQARAAGVYAPGGSSQHFGGGYVYAQYWLTGEERAQAYETKDKGAGANFMEPKIKNPLNAGGFGAWSVGARYDTLNLNSGPYSGSGLANMLAYTTYIAPNAAMNYAIANSGVYGGRAETVTTGINWYPDRGYHLQLNWIHALHVSAPLNTYSKAGFYENGSHPDVISARAMVYW
ncbi:OprO/OprP family phosphate-selective porin [Methylocystis parvus]|uniref:Carbohydrate porin n=1 Tax=Methylocystis parvus TaxID=134 RepID=A0A6B8M342_9HYPH|nr:porin [Methylocystis parvus]QGM99337.1 carbohydrate porin [Methylocystis parvus]WBK00273.1 porin [Methylocystis parvus OBBP]